MADVAQVVPTTFGRESSESVGAILLYSVNDPYALVARFTTDEGDVDWTFARDLLLDGAHFPTGEGDVRISPAGDGQLAVLLASPSGRARLFFDASVVASFLERSYELVPDGEEWRYCRLGAWLDEVSEQIF